MENKTFVLKSREAFLAERATCKVCGFKLTYCEKFTGLYCNEYCCQHCPDAKVSPCAKEEKFGGFFG